MDKNKFSLIANRKLKINNPISLKKIDEIINLIDLKEKDVVVDFGGGKGEIIIRFIEKFDVNGLLVELNPEIIKEASNFSNAGKPKDKLVLKNIDANEFLLSQEKNSIDCAICIGATGAFGDYHNTIKTLEKYVKKGGYILLGEGYWKKNPDEIYLKSTGIKKSEFASHYDNIKFGEEQGLIYLYSNVSSEDDWDYFEGLFSFSVESYVLENPDDPDNKELLEKIRNWRTNYLKYGRYTLGFGLYLFKKN